MYTFLIIIVFVCLIRLYRNILLYIVILPVASCIFLYILVIIIISNIYKLLYLLQLITIYVSIQMNILSIKISFYKLYIFIEYLTLTNK